MRYSIKSIFKSKITLTFIILLIILNLYTLVNLENIVDDSNNELAIMYESRALRVEEQIDSEERFKENLNLNDSQRVIFDNDIRQKEWEVEGYRLLAEKLQKNPLDDFYEERVYFGLEKQLIDMDCHANPDKGRPFAKDVFKEEVEVLDLDKEYPFDSEKLHLIDQLSIEGLNVWDEEANEIAYNSIKTELKATLDLTIAGGKQLYLGKPSPWVFYINKIGMEKYSYQLFAVLIIVFAGGLILEDRKNRSDNIVKLLPKKRSYIINHYNELAFISIISIFLIIFVVPMIYLGVKYDFSGLNNPIFTYKEGFTSFAGYEHVEAYNFYGLGKMYGTKPPFEGDFYMPSILTAYPLVKLVGLSLVITMLKVILFTIIGVGLGLSFSSIKISSLSLGLVSIFYLVSQKFADKFKFNPFSIESSWDVTTGAASYTWFKSVLLLVVSIMILYFIFYLINERKDYTD